MTRAKSPKPIETSRRGNPKTKPGKRARWAAVYSRQQRRSVCAEKGRSLALTGARAWAEIRLRQWQHLGTATSAHVPLRYPQAWTTAAAAAAAAAANTLQVPLCRLCSQ